MHDFQFCDAQALGALTSTGEVSDNVFDMELSKSGGDTIIEDDQLVGDLNIKIPANAAQTAASGMNIYLRSCDVADMTTNSIDLGVVFISTAEMVSGCVKNIQIIKSLTQKFVGLFIDPVSETLITGTTIDAQFNIAPLTENDKLQKVPSR